MPKDGKFGYAVETDDVFVVADARHDRFDVIGHSGGGEVAFTAANDRPDRIVGLLLVDPAPDPAVVPTDQNAATLKGRRDDYKGSIGQHYCSIAGPNPEMANQIAATAQSTSPAMTLLIEVPAYPLTMPARANQRQFSTGGQIFAMRPAGTHVQRFNAHLGLLSSHFITAA